MKDIRKKVLRRLKSERGANLAEYAAGAALILLVAIGVLSQVGSKIVDVLSAVASGI